MDFHGKSIYYVFFLNRLKLYGISIVKATAFWHSVQFSNFGIETRLNYFRYSVFSVSIYWRFCHTSLLARIENTKLFSVQSNRKLISLFFVVSSHVRPSFIPYYLRRKYIQCIDLIVGGWHPFEWWCSSGRRKRLTNDFR